MQKETKRTVILLVVAFIVGGAFWSAVPNLFVAHKRIAPLSGFVDGEESPRPERGGGGGGGGGEPDRYAALRAPNRFLAELIPSAEAAVPDRKVVRTAQLGLIVSDVNRAADSIRQIVQHRGGFVEKSSFQEDVQHHRSGEMVIRVPASGLDEALAELKKLAIRVRRESVEARDVTREYVDTDASLRNLRAQEEQYLSILKRASTIKDTLDATEKVQEARGEIDRLQGELNYLRGQVEMSTINIAVEPEAEAQVAGIYWRPLVNARSALRGMLQGMGDWVDSIVTFIISLPLILVWVLTVLFVIGLLWRFGRRVWRVLLPGLRGRRPEPMAPSAPRAD